jgi:hypothetical protein
MIVRDSFASEALGALPPLPLLPLPSAPPQVIAWMSRARPQRDPDDDVRGTPLYLPRLDVVVVAHAAAANGWLCTVVATAQLGNLPIGVATVSTPEITTAIGVPNPWFPLADLSFGEWCAAWLMRVIADRPHQSSTLARALLADVDPDTLQVVTAHTANPRLAPRAGCGLRPPAVQAGCDRLVAAGFLVRLHDEHDDAEHRYGLTIARRPWPRPVPR